MKKVYFGTIVFLTMALLIFAGCSSPVSTQPPGGPTGPDGPKLSLQGPINATPVLFNSDNSKQNPDNPNPTIIPAHYEFVDENPPAANSVIGGTDYPFKLDEYNNQVQDAKGNFIVVYTTAPVENGYKFVDPDKANDSVNPDDVYTNPEDGLSYVDIQTDKVISTVYKDGDKII
ncbi:MAG: hypothetical protein FWF22_03375, partial [Treponema sp.]|nr:hypothetical protein [Treponema sp.]